MGKPAAHHDRSPCAVISKHVGRVKSSHRLVAHYHGERNHQGLGNELITPENRPLRATHVRSRERLGGLLRYSIGRPEHEMSFRTLRGCSIPPGGTNFSRRVRPGIVAAVGSTWGRL
jgi:hypothetical protein